jgi:hypothetical protein
MSNRFEDNPDHKVIYDECIASQSHAREIQSEYGRWLLASMLAAHTGGLIAITQTGAMAHELFSASGQFLIWGIITTMLSGGLTWLNYTGSFVIYKKFSDQLRDGKPLEAGRFSVWMTVGTFFLSPFVLTVSFVLLALAGLSALDVFGASASYCVRIPTWLYGLIK